MIKLIKKYLIILQIFSFIILLTNCSSNNTNEDTTQLSDIEKMRTAGLAIGGNLNNAIVVDKYKILNPEGLRLEKEFVKHKALDCIGDFYLLGMQLIGNIDCFAPGHNLNQQLVREVLKNKNNYSIEDILPENNNDKFLDLIDNNNTSTNITYVA